MRAGVKAVNLSTIPPAPIISVGKAVLVYIHKENLGSVAGALESLR